MEIGKVCYLAPDTLLWENTNKGYGDFIGWCFSGDLELYYETMRWPGWQDEVERLDGGKVFSFYPPPWSDGPSIGERDRRPIGMAEWYDLLMGKLKPENQC